MRRCVLVSTLIILALTTSSIARAANITVNTAADSNGTCDPTPGDCSLREAINAANALAGQDTITFAANYTITLVGSQLPAVTTEIVITGTGAATTIVQSNATRYVATYRVFEVSNFGNLTLNNLTVRNGRCNGSCPNGSNSGGGIYNAGTLEINNSVVSDNQATTLANGKGGGIYSSGPLTIDASTLDGNRSEGYGGGIYNNGGMLTIRSGCVIGAAAPDLNYAPFGGGIANISGTAIIETSTVAGNDGGGGGGIFNQGMMTIRSGSYIGDAALGNSGTTGGGIRNEGDMTIDASTVAGNTATTIGGGIYNNGGTLTIQKHSVIGRADAPNTAVELAPDPFSSPDGGGIYNSGGTLTIDASTVSANTADNGGGIYNSSGTLTIQNGSVIGGPGVGAGNTAAVSGGGVFNMLHSPVATTNATASCIVGNTDSTGTAFVNGDTTNTQTATGNWWGDTGGPGVGSADEVDAYWNTSGWLTAPTLDCGGGPSGLSAAVNGANGINLTWVDNSSDETGYRLERSPNGTSGWLEVATPAANAVSYGDSGLTCNTPYSYRLRAYRSGDGQYSSYSNVATATTAACPPPNAPTVLAATASGMTAINLSWVDNSGDEIGFSVERSPDGTSGWLEIATPAANAVSYHNGGLTCNTPYSYRVRAYRISDGQYSSYSNVATDTTAACPPPNAPTVLSAAVNGADAIDLSWVDNSGDETSFSLERSLNGTSGWLEIATPAANAVSYGDSGLTCNTAYFYRLRAYRSGDGQYSSYSNAASTTTAACPPPNAPTGLTATASGMTAINLTWVDNSGDETSFSLERSPNGTSGWLEIATPAVNAVSYSDSGLTCNTPYFYRLRAYRSGDGQYSSYSNVATDTTDSTPACLPPNAPTGLSAAANGPNAINLSWVDNSNNETSFSLERSLNGSTGWAEIAMPAANAVSYGDSGLTCNTAYFYRLRAYRSDNGKYSTFSNVAQATTAICLNNLPSPALKTPKNGVPVYKSVIKLGWKAVKGAKGYHVEIDSDSSFVAPLVQSGDPAKPKFVTQPLDFGIYFWRVATKDALSQSIYSAPFSFEVTLNKTPKKGVTLKNGVVKFKWQAVKGATYDLQVNTLEDFTGTMVIDTVPLAPLSKPSYAVDKHAPLAPGTYFWRVRANGGDWTLPWHFSF